MVLCLAGHHPVLSIGGNARRQGLKTTFALLCPRSPGLTPRSVFGYSIVDSLITAKACPAKSKGHQDAKKEGPTTKDTKFTKIKRINIRTLRGLRDSFENLVGWRTIATRFA
jgi:hypothetical protein